MIRPLVIMTLCGALGLAANLSDTGPVLVELFTSEGCSGCPQAERFLARYANSSDVIFLSEHVDYWDTAAWKDPFSSPLFSTRQMDFANALGLRNLSTPQVVVNGERELTGPRFTGMSSAIRATPARRTSVTLRWVRSDACLRENCAFVSLTVGSLPAGSHKSDVLLAIAENGLESLVLGGENGGKRLPHANVVRTIMQIAEVDPAKPGEYTAVARVNFRSEWVRNNLKVVVFVQDHENRRILGAASITMPSGGVH